MREKWMTALPAMLIVRHSLLAHGKRLVLALAVWNGAALALLGFIQHGLSAPGPLWCVDNSWVFSKLRYGHTAFFSTFGYPNMAGDYFNLLFGIAIALWRDNCDRLRKDRAAMDISGTAAKPPHMFWAKHYFRIPAVLCFYAALNTMSRAAIMMATISATIYTVHAFAMFLARLRKKVERVRALAFGLLGIGLLVFVATLFLPEGIDAELGTVGTSDVLNRVSSRGSYHVRVATEIWKDNFAFGVGGWGYKHFCLQYMTDKELRQIQMVGGVNVHNDYLQFLAEHGLVGFGLMVTVVVLLLMPLGRVWRAMVDSIRFIPNKEQPPQPVQLFVIPAPVFCILATAVATFIHGFGDCPLRSPAVLSLFFVSLACIDGFLPRLKKRDDDYHHS